MKCPFCRKVRTRVIDSRTANRGFIIRRRRSCLTCKRRFTTYERPERKNIRVVKRDGSREPFDWTKIRESIAIACNKRPVRDAQIDRAANRVEAVLLRDQPKVISSTRIGELVLAELKKLDKVAYVRYASVFRGFADVEQFVKEAARIKKR